MKLPDFKDSNMFNDLRMQINAPLSFYKLKITLPEPKYKERSLIANTTYPPPLVLPFQGLDITSGEITTHSDGTLIYKNRRVLIHIRDVTSVNGRSHIPRFHIANCKTLIEMKSSGRFEKYVAADNDDGNFYIRLNGGPLTIRKLDVCQNCLHELSWDGFQIGMGSSLRHQSVVNFSIKKFFLKYPKSLHPVTPTYTYETAPLNDYPDNWDQISNELKRQVNYRCQNENCDKQLSYEHKHFLHVHHKNGLKNDCSPNNLVCLCIGCHSEQPNHSNIKNTPEYLQFKSIYK